MTTIDLSDKILKKIMEDRQKDYGDFKENFRLISVLFNVILHDKLKDDIAPHEVAQLMMGLKLYRTTRNYKADNYDDLEIYSKMAKELHKLSIDKKE
jgi:hypothetical protein|tara:strand:+ start:855 stop:1145 length:291 start_codon:yes stop_codon:yes gene_type:complete